MHKNPSKFVKIPISEQIALAETFYFAQVVVFSMLINKNVLEWLLLITCKKNTLYQADKSSHRRCSIKKLLLKISQYSQGDICVGVSFSP